MIMIDLGCKRPCSFLYGRSFITASQVTFPDTKDPAERSLAYLSSLQYFHAGLTNAATPLFNTSNRPHDRKHSQSGLQKIYTESETFSLLPYLSSATCAQDRLRRSHPRPASASFFISCFRPIFAQHDLSNDLLRLQTQRQALARVSAVPAQRQGRPRGQYRLKMRVHTTIQRPRRALEIHLAEIP